jgi:hypothetical protein
VLTALTRLLNEQHKGGMKKMSALNAAIDRAGLLAAGRNEKLSDELRTTIANKADSIWGKK